MEHNDIMHEFYAHQIHLYDLSIRNMSLQIVIQRNMMYELIYHSRIICDVLLSQMSIFELLTLSHCLDMLLCTIISTREN